MREAGVNAFKKYGRGQKPRVTYNGRTYVCKSYTVEIPILAGMERFAALLWLNKNTYPRGTSNQVEWRFGGDLTIR